jgi:beta-ribofuranosylaminobenzene 5'-phosphate synthase
VGDARRDWLREVIILTRVVAPARLHFGLFNETGLDGKVDGGAGMAVSFPVYDLSIDAGSPTIEVSCHVSQDMLKAMSKVIEVFRVKFGLPDFRIMVHQSIPEHVGLGSKTACLMALAQAINHYFSLEVDYIDLARLVGRGGTSGIGVHVSRVGGMVVDAGHIFPDEKRSFTPSSVSSASPPPLVASVSAPERCKVVYFRLEHQGLSGDLECNFFAKNCPIPEWETRQLLEIVDSRLLPGMKAGSLYEINRALSSIQGLGLKAREWSRQGVATRALLQRWRAADFWPRVPLCLSSTGSTVFVLTDEPELVKRQLVDYGVSPQSISVTDPWSGGYLIEER